MSILGASSKEHCQASAGLPCTDRVGSCGRKPLEVASKEKMAFPCLTNPPSPVLPLVNMSDDPKQEFFSDGMTARKSSPPLSKDPYLFVIARQSTFAYKSKPVKVKQVSEELGVRYVLEGSVRRSGEKVRITAQLIDAMTAIIFGLNDTIATSRRSSPCRMRSL